MSVDVVVRSEVRTAEEMVEVVVRWLAIAGERDREMFGAFVAGMAAQLGKADETKEVIR